MTMHPQAPAAEHPLRALLLDLLYPAVLGAMIVLLFIRMANASRAGFTEPSTYFGILVASYYAAGFVNARTHHAYTIWLAALDSFSTGLIFVSFYFLGLAQEHAPPPPNYPAFYGVLLAVVLTPTLRRMARGEARALRTWLAVITAVAIMAAILGTCGVTWLAWLTPSTMVVILCAAFAIYLVDLLRSGPA